MKSANPENEYIPLDLRISVRRDTLRLISEMAQDMGISINEVFSFLAEDSVIDLELLEDLNKIDTTIYTSGLGGLFKPGIPIGKIYKDSENKVDFFSDFTQLNYVKITSFSIGDKN